MINKNIRLVGSYENKSYADLCKLRREKIKELKQT